MEHAKSVDSQTDYRSLLSQTLCDMPSQTFSANLKTKFVRGAYIAGIGKEVRLGAKANTWCIMLKFAGLSSVLSVFRGPEIFLNPTEDMPCGRHVGSVNAD